MKVRKRDEQSFGWRLMKIREDREMSQKEVVDKLADYDSEGIPRSIPALSQLELGMTKRVHVDLLLALSEILNVSVGYLITGIEPESPTAWSEEAEQVARLIDQMQPPTRQVLLSAAKAALEAERQLRKQTEQQMFESEKELSRIMKSYASHLENSDRKVVDAYIDRIDRIDRLRNAAQSET